MFRISFSHQHTSSKIGFSRSNRPFHVKRAELRTFSSRPKGSESTIDSLRFFIKRNINCNSPIHPRFAITLSDTDTFGYGLHLEYFSFIPDALSKATYHAVSRYRFRRNGGSSRRVVADTSILGKSYGVDRATALP